MLVIAAPAFAWGGMTTASNTVSMNGANWGWAMPAANLNINENSNFNRNFSASFPIQNNTQNNNQQIWNTNQQSQGQGFTYPTQSSDCYYAEC